MQFQIIWHYQPPKGKSCSFTSEWLEANAALLLATDLERTGRVKELQFVDEQQQSWTLKEAKKLLKEVETEPHDIIAYFDGGYNKTEKLAGLGIVVYYKKNGKHFRIRQNELLQEITSNNEAEYAAFLHVVDQLELLGAHHLKVVFRGDSQVVLNQLSGEWPCFEDQFNRYLDRIEEKLQKLGISPVYEAISRKQNQEADQLATQALQGIDISSHAER
ncbi:ribonuclease H family protein [Priestia koreensis]|uniref:ribonuclease H family protein n=1 Tax=Priestia koreensis TaxID=284581 RepID=UPI0028F7351F|nr:ribonuclease H family protein [Priestia koreensis]